MAELSKIRKNGVDYDIKDATARAAIEELKQNGTGGTTTETVTKTGTVVSLSCKEGQEITVSGDVTGTLELVQHGKNFIPPVQNIVEQNGITFSVNEDGSVHISGTATKTFYPDIVPKAKPGFLPAGTYTLSTNFPSEVGGVISIKSIISGAFAEFTANNSTSPKTMTVEDGVTYQCFFNIMNGKTYDHDVWVQLEYGEVATDYEKSVAAITHAITLPSTVSAIAGNNVLYFKEGEEVTASIEVDTKTVTKTGVVVSIEVDKGMEIMVNADTTEAVELYHSGINLFPKGIRKDSSRYPDVVQNADGSISFSGVLSEKNYYTLCTDSGDEFWLPPGQYTFTGFGFPRTETAVTAYITLIAQDGTTPFDGKNAVSLHADNYGKRIIIHDGTLVKATLAFTNEVPDDLTIGYMLCRNDIVTAEFVAPTLNKVETVLPTRLSAYESKNIFYTRNADVLTVSYTKAESSIDTDSVNKLIANALKFDPTPYGIPVLTLNGACAGMSKENYVLLDFTFRDKEGNPIAGIAEVKKQGSSSISIGAQIGKDFDTDVGGLFNFTIKFPEAFEAKEGWGSQRKYVFKANAIDHSHARNVCSCKLWGEIVKSRANVPTELSSLVNGGAIDGFPIAVVLNDKFYALGTFNIPKDGWMFGNPKAILCADAHTDPTKFKALATLNGDFELEYVEDENNADWVLTSINRAIQAVIDSDGTDIDTTIGQYIDIPSAIDYYIHTVNESADDGTSKNYILVTFDGVKWYFSAYDRDTTYGIRWDGTSFNRNPVSGITFKTFADNHALMNLIFTHKKSELKARALQLNNQVTCEMNVYYVFVNFIAGIPAELYAQNCKRWPLLRSTSVSNLDQILNWYRMRRAFLDKLIEEM